MKQDNTFVVKSVGTHFCNAQVYPKPKYEAEGPEQDAEVWAFTNQEGR